jgi:fluoride exporter
MDMAMEKLLIIGLGGGLGSILRYLLGSWMQARIDNASFPAGTVLVNILGCFVIGFLSYLSDAKDVWTGEMRAFLFIGVLGGFTTFSTFANESVNLFRDGEFAQGLLNVGVQVLVGLAAVMAGRVLAQIVWR